MATIDVTPTLLSETQNTLHWYKGAYDTYQISAENLSNLSIIVKTTPGEETSPELENMFVINKMPGGIYDYDTFTFARDGSIEIMLTPENISNYIVNGIIQCRYKYTSQASSYEIAFRQYPNMPTINVQVTVTETP